MPRTAAVVCHFIVILMMVVIAPAADIKDFTAPPHNYWTQPPRDRFTKLFEQVKSGSMKLDERTPNAYLSSLLRALEIPLSSQLLVFSVTSLQSNLISPTNPRALYFNEDTYVGYVPGGRIEIASFDPELGAIFYIFQIPRGGEAPLLDRSNRCFNCHAGSFSHHVPGLFVESVISGDNGGPLVGFRREASGHGVPFAERYGGWHVTSKLDFPTKANTLGDYYQGKLTTRPNPPGAIFDLQNYLVPTSDIVPHLIHEHQVGFTNRVIEANYSAREKFAAGQGKLASADTAALNDLATGLVRYILFADEAKLPAPVQGEETFLRDFTGVKKASATGLSLRELDLMTRLLKHRCSYMIYSSLWDGMHPFIKQSVEAKLWNALKENSPDPAFAYLPTTEKRAIRQIIKETKPGLPSWWE
ncbi:MAG: hypothetical protein K8R87_00620 [Verrucomicrobia bacterium]|nr:hypothetical protein [Verrucomicrobiota bacterium]